MRMCECILYMICIIHTYVHPSPFIHTPGVYTNNVVYCYYYFFSSYTPAKVCSRGSEVVELYDITAEI